MLHSCTIQVEAVVHCGTAAAEPRRKTEDRREDNHGVVEGNDEAVEHHCHDHMVDRPWVELCCFHIFLHLGFLRHHEDMAAHGEDQDFLALLFPQ